MAQWLYLKHGSILLEAELVNLKRVLLLSHHLVSRKIRHQRVFPLLKSKMVIQYLIFLENLLIHLLKYPIPKKQINKQLAT